MRIGSQTFFFAQTFHFAHTFHFARPVYFALVGALLLAGAACSSGSDNPSSTDTFSDPFLASNAVKEGVTVTDSGLQYEVLRASDGARPIETSQITVHYRGTLTDGTEFDSSYARNEPSTFPLNGTIRGWIEGLQLMNVGSQFRLVVPPELGYGERGAGESIPPDAVLIFEVELLEVNSA